MDEAPMMRCRIEARALIESGRLKLWQDGESCAMCAVRVDGKNACLTHVYTPPEHRRQGYAAQLAYTVTRDALARGLRAMLYADADYAASNACYAGLGYAPQGTIYTLQKP